MYFVLSVQYGHNDNKLIKLTTKTQCKAEELYQRVIHFIATCVCRKRVNGKISLSDLFSPSSHPLLPSSHFQSLSSTAVQILWDTGCACGGQMARGRTGPRMWRE